MDKSEIGFKYRAGSTNIQIPTSVNRGEYYVNTGSSFMFLKSASSSENSLLLPGVIYDNVDDSGSDGSSRSDGLTKEDTYKANALKRYLIFKKYGANSGRFVPSDVTSICIVHADLAEVKDGAIKVKVNSAYIDTVTNELSKVSVHVFAVIGYTTDEYKEESQFGSSAMVKLSDIDSNGYSTVSDVVSGYILMKNAPSAEDIINYGVTGMSWHVYDESVTLDDGTHRYGTARLTCQGNNSEKIMLELFTPVYSVCNRSVMYIDKTQAAHVLTIDNDGTDHITTCHLKIDMTVTEALDFCLKYFPSVKGIGASYDKSNKKVYPAIPSNAVISVCIDKSDLTTDIVNCLMNAGIYNHRISNEDGVVLEVSKSANSFLKNSVPLLGGLELKVATNKLTIPVWVIDTDQYSNVPVSFIHGTVYGETPNVAPNNTNLGNACNISISEGFDSFDKKSTFYHINAMYFCYRHSLLGGDGEWDLLDDGKSQAYPDEPAFLMVDYQPITLNNAGKGLSDTAPLRKYIRLSHNGGTVNFSTPQGNMTITIK